MLSQRTATRQTLLTLHAPTAEPSALVTASKTLSYSAGYIMCGFAKPSAVKIC